MSTNRANQKSSVKKAIAGIGERIREVRGSLSQEEFCRFVGVPKRTLVRYELGQTLPNAQTVAVICKIFQIDPWWLLFGSQAATSLSIPPTARVRSLEKARIVS